LASPFNWKNVPPTDLAGHGERHLAVALAGRGGLKLGNALLKVGAAVSPEVSRLGCWRHARNRYETKRCEQRHATC
jgi:hypothetical protein